MPGFCMRMWLGKFAMIRLDTNSTIDQNRAHAWAWLVGAFALLLAVPPAGEAATAKRAPVVTPDQGIATQTKAIAKNPKNATAYLRRSDYHLALAGTDGSEAHLRAAADDLAVVSSLTPKDPDAHRRYAEIATKLREHQLAVSEYSAAIDLVPKKAEYYLGRGLAYLSLRKDRPAKADFKQALKLNPGLRQRLEEEEKRIRLARQQMDAYAGSGQVAGSPADRWAVGSPDLACSARTPIHMISQCNTAQPIDIAP